MTTPQIGSLWQYSGVNLGLMAIVTFVGTVYGRMRVRFYDGSTEIFDIETMEKYYTKVR
jgi:hypothetical protein